MMGRERNHNAPLAQGAAVQIAGAGIAGLSAAITLARAGYGVVVHEAQAEVGQRFAGDLQGLENWSQPGDVLQELSSLGLTTEFRHHPCRQGVIFDAWDRDYRVTSPEPLLYLLERGPGPDSLDSALLQQALALGVDVRFNSPVRHPASEPWILATGPKTPYAIAVGYHFSCDMENGFWAICDRRLAPGGYAYLVVLNGQASMKSCLFGDFAQQQTYLQRTRHRFEQLLGLELQQPQAHGGVISAHLPDSAQQQGQLLVGERAGFQDHLWGFGMRLAIHSGVLASRSLLDGSGYDQAWRQQLASLQTTSQFNRALYGRLGNRGLCRYLRHVQRQADTRQMLYRLYRPSLLKRLLSPLCAPSAGHPRPRT